MAQGVGVQPACFPSRVLARLSPRQAHPGQRDHGKKIQARIRAALHRVGECCACARPRPSSSELSITFQRTKGHNAPQAHEVAQGEDGLNRFATSGRTARDTGSSHGRQDRRMRGHRPTTKAPRGRTRNQTPREGEGGEIRSSLLDPRSACASARLAVANQA